MHKRNEKATGGRGGRRVGDDGGDGEYNNIVFH